MISSVTDFTGRQVVYTYDANLDLRSARSPVVAGTPNNNNFSAGKTTNCQVAVSLSVAAVMLRAPSEGKANCRHMWALG